MSRGSREYLAWNISRDPVEAQQRLWEIEDALKDFEQTKRVSWFGRVLHTPDDIEVEALDPDRVAVMTDGKLPVIFLNVTFYLDEVRPADLAPLEQRFELHLFAEASERSRS